MTQFKRFQDKGHSDFTIVNRDHIVKAEFLHFCRPNEAHVRLHLLGVSNPISVMGARRVSRIAEWLEGKASK